MNGSTRRTRVSGRTALHGRLGRCRPSRRTSRSARPLLTVKTGPLAQGRASRWSKGVNLFLKDRGNKIARPWTSS